MVRRHICTSCWYGKNTPFPNLVELRSDLLYVPLFPKRKGKLTRRYEKHPQVVVFSLHHLTHYLVRLYPDLKKRICEGHIPRLNNPGRHYNLLLEKLTSSGLVSTNSIQIRNLQAAGVLAFPEFRRPTPHLFFSFCHLYSKRFCLSPPSIVTWWALSLTGIKTRTFLDLRIHMTAFLKGLLSLPTLKNHLG